MEIYYGKVHFFEDGRPIGEGEPVDLEGAVELLLSVLGPGSSCLLSPIGVEGREWEEGPNIRSFL
jgi:hypothetical protein